MTIARPVFRWGSTIWREQEPKVPAPRLSLMTIDTYMNMAKTPVAVPRPYISRRNMATPPEEGSALDSFT